MEPCEGVLGRIVAHKREEIARRASDVPITEMRRRAIPTTRSLRDALARPGTRFVLEHKRASPSQGTLRATTSTSPREVAQAYEGASDAMSVLTDTRFFGGSFDDLHSPIAQIAGEDPSVCRIVIDDQNPFAKQVFSYRGTLPVWCDAKADDSVEGATTIKLAIDPNTSAHQTKQAS